MYFLCEEICFVLFANFEENIFMNYLSYKNFNYTINETPTRSQGGLLALPANIRIVWNWLTVTYTLAYFAVTLFSVVEKQVKTLSINDT